MPHIAKHLLENDPDGLARLREILHGRNAALRTGKVVHTTPTLAERFGTQTGKRDKALPPRRGRRSGRFATTASG